MKWVLEINDTPTNKNFPIIGYQFTEHGVKRGPYNLAINDVIDSLMSPLAASSDGAFTDEKRIPTLPYGTVGYSFTPDGKERVSMMIEKDIWPIKYQNQQETYFIGFPKTIFQFLLTPIGNRGHRKIIGTKAFAIKDDHSRVDDCTVLYSFPFPNVNKDNGDVCWGGNSEFTIPRLTELGKIFNLFLTAPFGEDYGMRVSNGLLRFSDYIKSENERPFNDDWLIPIAKSDGNKTFGDLYNQNYVTVSR